MKISVEYLRSTDDDVRAQGNKLYEQCEILSVRLKDLVAENNMPTTRLNNVAAQTSTVRQTIKSLQSLDATEHNSFQKGVIQQSNRTTEQKPLMVSQRQKPIEPK